MKNRHEDRSAPVYCSGSQKGLFDILNAGSKFVIEHDSKPALKLLIKLCKQDDIEEILELQKRVYDHIGDKNTFVMTTEQELADSLKEDVCIGAYHGNILVGFTLMITNPDSPRNLGLHLDYDREKLKKCVTYDTTFVDPHYSGYGLQRIFIRLKDRLAWSGGATEALATVSPDNTVSLNNLKNSGFSVAGQKTMYGGYERLILSKPLKRYIG
jgi:hypothetical protein